jgi:hypothetical protein
VTADDVRRLLAQYRAGIEAELQLLRQLAEVSAEQRETSNVGDFARFNAVSDARDRIMRSLVTIEENLRAVRQELTAHRELASTVEGYDEVAARHREAAHLVNEILSTDQRSLSALADAELARRSAVVSLERGETTLAAYRRVLAPPVASARLVDKRG